MREGDCIHFTGIGVRGDARGGHGRTCKAGVNYRDLSGGRDEGWVRRLPCLQGLPKDSDVATCQSFRAMTREEHDTRQAEVKAAVNRVLSSIAAGKCHVCGAEAEPSRLVGRCRYNACGHRRGQEACDEE